MPIHPLRPRRRLSELAGLLLLILHGYLSGHFTDIILRLPRLTSHILRSRTHSRRTHSSHMPSKAMSTPTLRTWSGPPRPLGSRTPPLHNQPGLRSRSRFRPHSIRSFNRNKTPGYQPSS